MNLEPDDCLDALISLPLTRLSQVLTTFSTRQPAAEVWALLLWVELEREHRPSQLRPGTKQKLGKTILPGGSLERFLRVQIPFSTPIFEMTAQSMTQPLLEVRSSFPHHEQLLARLDCWTLGSEIAGRAVGHFLKLLPEEFFAAVRELAPADFVASRIEEARDLKASQHAPYLLEVYLFLLHRAFLPLSVLVNLYTPDRNRKDAKMLVAGLYSFWEEWARLYRSSTA